jgi:coatomer subunit beta
MSVPYLPLHAPRTDPLSADLNHIMASTNMACLTPEAALLGDCGFLSANLYARSLFGEDALANLSIEKGADGVLQGHVRIRSKTQGIALSLGSFLPPSPPLDACTDKPVVCR